MTKEEINMMAIACQLTGYISSAAKNPDRFTIIDVAKHLKKLHEDYPITISEKTVQELTETLQKSGS